MKNMEFELRGDSVPVFAPSVMHASQECSDRVRAEVADPSSPPTSFWLRLKERSGWTAWHECICYHDEGREWDWDTAGPGMRPDRFFKTFKLGESK